MDVGNISITGLIARDFDIQQVITQLGLIRSKPITLLQNTQTEHSQRLTAYQQLIASTLSLSTAASALTDGTAFSQVTASSANSSAVLASASAGAPVGSYEIAVGQLAQSHKIGSAPIASSSEALGYEGEFLLNGHAVSIAAGDSLTDIRDAINTAGAGVTASILTVSSSDHRLTIVGLTSGSDGAIELVDANTSGMLEALGLQDAGASVKNAISDGAAGDALGDTLSPVGDVLGLSAAPSGTVQINGTNVAIDLATDSLEDVAAAIAAIEGVSATVESVTVDGETAWRLEIVGDAGQPAFSDDNNVLVTLGVLQKGLANEIDAAQDAQFSIDGVEMTRSTNAVDDAIENVQLQLLQETGEDDVRVSIGASTSATVADVESFVTAYNRVVGFINSNQSFDADAEQGGLFFGSPAIMNFESSLRDQVSGLVASLGGDLQLASQIGLSFDSSDQLSLDSSKLLASLATDPEGVKRLFGVRTDAGGSAVEVMGYTSATADSGADGWEVQITQEATRATATSASLASGITADETLTVNGKSVGLTAGMTLEAAAERLNALFTAQHMDIEATVETDRLVVKHDLYGNARSISIVSSLDDGTGGTDLGGATAGEAEVSAGFDVAGTIGGHAATGSGRLLTGNSGTGVAGLQLVVSAEAPGSAGVVRVSKGISARMTDLIEVVTDENGSLTRAAAGVTTDIEAIDEQIAKIDADVDRYIAQLQIDFAVMEVKMSQSLAMLDWMQNQIETLSGSGN